MYYQYSVDVNFQEGMCGENDFWKFMRKYGRAALSNPLGDDELLGKCFTVPIESQSPITLDLLISEFHSLAFSSLEQSH